VENPVPDERFGHFLGRPRELAVDDVVQEVAEPRGSLELLRSQNAADQRAALFFRWLVFRQRNGHGSEQVVNSEI
jgi:hypothetical protein